MPVMFLGTAGACHIVKHKLFPPIMAMVQRRPEYAHVYNGLTAQNCRELYEVTNVKKFPKDITYIHHSTIRIHTY